MSLRVLIDNFLDATHCSDLAVSPAAEPAFPITNLQSNVRDAGWRSTSLATQVITGTFGGNARRISAWGVWPALLSSLIGATVRVELFSDAAMATSVYDSGTLQFFTPTGENWNEFIYAIHPWNVEQGDRTARRAPLVKWFTAVYVSSFRITIANGGAVDTAYFEAERIWLSDYVEAPFGARPGAVPRRGNNDELTRTPGGILRRLEQGSWNGLSFENVLQTEAQRSVWWEILEACRPASEVVVSLFAGDTSAKKERDFTVKGSMRAPNRELVFGAGGVHTLQLEIEES
jgi:hypothetical protein